MSRRIRTFISITTLACAVPTLILGSPLPRLEELNGRQALFVDGQPFLIRGLQWDCDSCYAAEIMDPLFPAAARMGCNTAALPLYWNEIEMVEGKYSFAMLDHRLDQARRTHLRLVLLWFGSYKNGCLNYAPDFIKRDQQRFRRVHRPDGTELHNFSGPTSAQTQAADRQAVETVFRHLKKVDGRQHTVILFQMENEVGILGSDRCYCDECARQFTAGGWQAKYGARANEMFTAQCLATYLDGLTEVAQAPLSIAGLH